MEAATKDTKGYLTMYLAEMDRLDMEKMTEEITDVINAHPKVEMHVKILVLEAALAELIVNNIKEGLVYFEQSVEIAKDRLEEMLRRSYGLSQEDLEKTAGSETYKKIVERHRAKHGKQ